MALLAHGADEYGNKKTELFSSLSSVQSEEKRSKEYIAMNGAYAVSELVSDKGAEGG